MSNDIASPVAPPPASTPPGPWLWPPPEQPSALSRLFGRLRKRRALGPGMALYLLSPVVAELCSGATPWYSYIFFGPMLCLMYGGGAILIREMTLRWGKGWPTILALGVAYAIAEEGIAVRTFFDRTAPVVKPLGDYGWFGGTNWVWDVHLSLYHAIISIAVPIFLVMLAYPARRNQPWIGDRWLKKAAVGYVGVIVFWLVVYKTPVDGGYILAGLAVIAALIWLARRLPASIELPAWPDRSPGSGRAPTPKRVAIVAFAATFGIFAMDWGRGLGLPAVGAIAIMLASSAVAGWWFVRGSRRPGWTDRQRYAIAAGIFFFLPLISPIIELSGEHGQIIVGIVTGWLLVRTWRRLRAREAEELEVRATEGRAATSSEDRAAQPAAPLMPAPARRPTSAC